VSIYVAFSDESAIADPGGEFLVAGYVASEDNWAWVTRAWQERVLDGPPRLPYLHMTDIRSSAWRSENSVSFNDAENRVSEGVRILYASGSLTAMASVIKRRDITEIIHSLYPSKKKIPTGLDEPDYTCYMAYLAIMLIRVRAVYPDAALVNFVCSSKNKKITKGLKDVLDVTRAYLTDYRPERAPLLGGLVTASPPLQLPLQCADVLCWHLQRYYSGAFDRTEENRMWYLLKERDGAIHKWEREDLEVFVKALREKGMV
jgi:hypothetical protein